MTKSILTQLHDQEIYLQENPRVLDPQYVKELLLNSATSLPVPTRSPSKVSRINQLINPTESTPDRDRKELYTSQVSIDDRILGDYPQWSFLVNSDHHTSRNLDDLLEEYYGIQPPLVGDKDTSFTKSGSYLCTHLMEVILRPDISSTEIMSCLQKVAATERLK